MHRVRRWLLPQRRGQRGAARALWSLRLQSSPATPGRRRTHRLLRKVGGWRSLGQHRSLHAVVQQASHLELQ